jgi:hypothetical protein
MTIQGQVEVLNKITQIMHESAELNYEEMTCRFEYYVDEGDWSVDSEFSFIRGGILHRARLNDPNGGVYRLVHQLHELMKAHTGGDWKSFVLTVDTTRKAHTKFAYDV